MNIRKRDFFKNCTVDRIQNNAGLCLAIVKREFATRIHRGFRQRPRLARDRSVNITERDIAHHSGSLRFRGAARTDAVLRRLPANTDADGARDILQNQVRQHVLESHPGFALELNRASIHLAQQAIGDDNILCVATAKAED
jgi:hypothetical protein